MKKIVIRCIGAAFAAFLLYEFAHGFYQGYTSRINDVEYYELAYVQPVQGAAIETVIIGKAPRHPGWKETADDVEQGYMQKCGSCRTVRKLKLETLSRDYSDMFAKRVSTYTYVSSDKSDTRMFFPSVGKQFDVPLCEKSIEQIKRSDNTAVCIGRT